MIKYGKWQVASGKGIIAQRTLRGVANMLLARFLVWVTSGRIGRRMARRIGRRITLCNPQCMHSTHCKKDCKEGSKKGCKEDSEVEGWSGSGGQR